MRGHLLCLILTMKDMSKIDAKKWMTGLQAQHGCIATGSSHRQWKFSCSCRLSDTTMQRIPMARQISKHRNIQHLQAQMVTSYHNFWTSEHYAYCIHYCSWQPNTQSQPLNLLFNILSCFPHHTCYSSLITTYEVLPKSPQNLNDARKSRVVQLCAARYCKLHPL